ncbi:MAG TPA: transcription-repair coupling factor [Planctomycetota bacterium]|nr:transcription-repair coupling factor [Planctomycetota bacterium]
MLGSPALERLNMALAQGRPARAGGVWGSSYALITAEAVPRPFLLILPTPIAAEEAIEDLRCFGASPVLFENLKQAGRFQEGAVDVLVADLPSALGELPSPIVLRSGRLSFAPGAKLDLAALSRTLVDSGYERSASVERPGEFAVRGGILDVFPLTSDLPIRVELSGDAIESLRSFDPSTQGSLDLVARLDFSLVPQEAPKTATLFDFLPAKASVVLKEPSEMNLRHARWEAAYAILARHPVLSLSSLPEPEAENLKILSLQRFTGVLANVERELEAVRRRHTIVYCANEGEEQRLRELISSPVEVRRGRLNHGFIFEDLSSSYIPHHELFNRYRLRRSVRRADTRPIDTLLEIERGDIVVHVTHGIGRFVGIERRNRQEFMVLEYAGSARLYVPVTNLDLVQRYVGGSENPPPLSTLGGDAWNAAKLRAQAAVEKLAQEMIQIQALRAMELGTAFPQDSEWQREFEAAFPYEETDDQLHVAGEIAADMHSTKPMDRLVCGDVGYGKTELAMRAAFRSAVANRQVAVLVPTTVLAQQHDQSFRERMADYPVRIESISRFKTKKEQKKILTGLAEGAIDIIIGTHRLVQPDVRFKDLGLVVIDEEQRFGVEHKEFLKRVRATVDVLTLTATPIPRTLHMALLGIRDISSLLTPPQDRLAIRTEILPYDERQIREAIVLELARGGQVYFVHNRVHNIDAIAKRLRLLVPEARISIGHGQMDEGDLEKTMLQFLAKEIDVLVCTTIIESGLDIPNVNTMIINQADIFGLADLHQLRGRVGRYKRQAYCYLLLPPDRPLIPQAQKRLKAIEEFSELGAGFKIAMRDLEIRGVGNLLGREQHGHIAAIGYDLYCRLLEKAVKKTRRQPVAEPLETHVDLGLDTWIPEDYIPDLRTRVEVYRRLTGCRSEESLDEAEREVLDRFGKIPPPVEGFIRTMRVKIRASYWELASVSPGTEGPIAKYRDRKKAEELRRLHPDAVRIVDAETILFVGKSVIDVLRPPAAASRMT